MAHVLIIEDDESIAELERDYLEINHYDVTIALTGTEGLELGLTQNPDIILLDLMLPGMNGFEICRALREKLDIPILMVTAKKDEIDKIRGLGIGADDYIVKPFSPSELVARVNAHLSRYERLTSSGQKDIDRGSIQVDDLKIQPTSHRVFLRDNEISLTNKEFELLYFMSSNPNIVFSRDILFDRVWGMDSLGDASTVTVHINRLREKIEDDTSRPRYIETVWGAGYRFNV